MSELFKDIPEFVEVSSRNPDLAAATRHSHSQTDIAESITARTETLGELPKPFLS